MDRHLNVIGHESEAAFAGLAAELEDEELDEAVQALVDEATGRHLASAGTWSSEAEGLLEHLELHFGARTPESLVKGEIEAVLGARDAHVPVRLRRSGCPRRRAARRSYRHCPAGSAP